MNENGNLEPDFWRKRSIEGSGNFRGKPKGLDAYTAAFGIRKRQLEGKVILDLGANKQLAFAKDVEERVAGAKVISFSPDFLFEDIRAEAVKSYPEGEKVIGLGQQLPFKDESFDFVFALHLAEHLDERTFLRIVEEMARILKPGGKGFFAPVKKGRFSFSEVRGNLRELNVKVREKPLPDSYQPAPVYDRFMGKLLKNPISHYYSKIDLVKTK